MRKHYALCPVSRKHNSTIVGDFDTALTTHGLPEGFRKEWVGLLTTDSFE
jgi:hypothetical protein